MLADPNDLAIVEGIVGLAEAFRIAALAEGVENEEIGATLIHLGCPLGQGYGIARPMPAEALPGWIERWRPPAAWTGQAERWSREDAILAAAEIDHRHWVERLRAWLAADDAAADAPALDARDCRFSRWYHGTGRRHYRDLPDFEAIEPLHRRVHELGAAIVAQRQAGDPAAARDALDALEATSQQLFERLHALAQAIRAAK